MKEQEVVETKEGANGSKYKFVGKCLVCGRKLWKCTTAPNFDMGIEHEETPVFVVGGRHMGGGGGEPEPLMTYCKAHNPMGNMKRAGLKPGDHIPGDLWKPQQR